MIIKEEEIQNKELEGSSLEIQKAAYARHFTQQALRMKALPKGHEYEARYRLSYAEFIVAITLLNSRISSPKPFIKRLRFCSMVNLSELMERKGLTEVSYSRSVLSRAINKLSNMNLIEMEKCPPKGKDNQPDIYHISFLLCSINSECPINKT